MKTLTEFITESNIEYSQVKTKSELLKIVNDTKPNKNKNEGFWLFKEAFDKDDAYTKIGENPWEIQYICAKDNNEICGLISYSLVYDEPNYTPSLHIFDIQTLSKFSGQHKSEDYFKYIEKIAKQNKKDYITLKCYEPKLEKLYSKYGFTKSDKEYNCMYKKI